MATLKTYDLRGNKLSFANWISNLSPVETPFTSMIGKEGIDQTRYSWQVDRLSAPLNAGFQEGSEFVAGTRPATRVMSNFTQILRKVVKVTDTANKVGLYGRASEKAYQMEKAGKEIRRDLEKAVLGNGVAVPGSSAEARKFAGFVSLVASLDLKDIDTGAVVHKAHKQTAADAPAFTEAAIFDMTYNLYLAGSKADKVMVHPKHMFLFSGLINNHAGNVTRMFKNVDDKFNAHVKSFRDPLGQTFTVIPNRFMAEDKVFFFTESDWTQMILRAPETRELARVGSAEKHMIEMEVGLRHRNPFASGVLELTAAAADSKSLVAELSVSPVVVGSVSNLKIDSLKNGALDSTDTAKVTITGAAEAGITNGSKELTLVGGTVTEALTATAPGSYLIKCTHADGHEVTVELQVQAAATFAVEEVAPKARKAKA